MKLQHIIVSFFVCCAHLAAEAGDTSTPISALIIPSKSWTVTSSALAPGTVWRVDCQLDLPPTYHKQAGLCELNLVINETQAVIHQQSWTFERGQQITNGMTIFPDLPKLPADGLTLTLNYFTLGEEPTLLSRYHQAVLSLNHQRDLWRQRAQQTPADKRSLRQSLLLATSLERPLDPGNLLRWGNYLDQPELALPENLIAARCPLSSVAFPYRWYPASLDKPKGLLIYLREPAPTISSWPTIPVQAQLKASVGEFAVIDWYTGPQHSSLPWSIRRLAAILPELRQKHQLSDVPIVFIADGHACGPLLRWQADQRASHKSSAQAIVLRDSVWHALPNALPSDPASSSGQLSSRQIATWFSLDYGQQQVGSIPTALNGEIAPELIEQRLRYQHPGWQQIADDELWPWLNSQISADLVTTPTAETTPQAPWPSDLHNIPDEFASFTKLAPGEMLLDGPWSIHAAQGGSRADRSRSQALLGWWAQQWIAHHGHPLPPLKIHRQQQVQLAENQDLVAREDGNQLLIGAPINHPDFAELELPIQWDRRTISTGQQTFPRSAHFVLLLTCPHPRRPGSWLTIVDGHLPTEPALRQALLDQLGEGILPRSGMADLMIWSTDPLISAERRLLDWRWQSE